MPDCGDNSCRYAVKRTGMRTNGGCRCDECSLCGAHIRPTYPGWHRQWCKMPGWVPPHHRGHVFPQHRGLTKEDIKLLSRPPEGIKILFPVDIEDDTVD